MTSFRQLVFTRGLVLINNQYVPLWRSHRVCTEAKTNRVSLVSLDLNPIEQLWDELWRRILDHSVQPRNL